MSKPDTPPRLHRPEIRKHGRHAAVAMLALLLAFAVRSAPAGAQTPGALNVSLTATPSTIAQGRSVHFSLSASPPAVRDGRLTSVSLDYGDGAHDDISGPFRTGDRVDRAPDHTYAAAGTYTAVLTATASDGESNSASQTITVTSGNHPPVGGLSVSLTATPASASTGDRIDFAFSAMPPSVPGGRITSLVLDFGDGVQDNVPGPFDAGERIDRNRDHAYTTAGTYTATLTATASNGETKNDSQTITITGNDHPPVGGLVVSLMATPNSASTGDRVNFALSATPPSVEGGRITSLVLDFGDGTNDDIPGPFDAGERVDRNRDHAYTTAGTYTATLTATASNGDTQSDTQTITISGGNQPPVGGLDVSLSASSNSISAGESASFSLSATPPSVLGGSITSLVLDYGDGVQDNIPGAFDAGEQVTRSREHTYDAPGTYNAVLTATASNGDTKSDSQTIAVSGGNQPPIGGLNVSLSASTSTVPAGQLVTFTASATPPSVLGGSIASMSIDFGDGTTADLGGGSAGQQVTDSTTHAYAAPGAYTAVLTATASNGQTGSATQTTTVFGTPTPNPTPPGPTTNVALQPGWNLIAIPNGATIPGPLGVLYTYQAGDTGYEIVQNPQSGLGYWAFLDSPTTETIPLNGPQTITQPLPPGQWVMLGNPGSTAATVSGADIVYVYSPITGYQPTTILQPGQGAWVLSINGGIVTITSP